MLLGPNPLQPITSLNDQQWASMFVPTRMLLGSLAIIEPQKRDYYYYYYSYYFTLLYFILKLVNSMYMVLEYERCQALMVFQKFNPLERSIKFHSFLNCLQIHTSNKIQRMQQRHYLSKHSRVHWGCPFCYKYRTHPISLLNQRVLDSHMSPRLWERWSVSQPHQSQSMAPSLSLYKCLYRYLLMMNFLSWWDFVMFCNVHTTPMMLSVAPKKPTTI